MNFALLRRRSVWWPTHLGWISILIATSLPILLWSMWGEKFLAKTDRAPNEVLIVEGWIGLDGLAAAKVEFEQGHYQFIVTSGVLHADRWNHHKINYSKDAAIVLTELGVPARQIIETPASSSENHRTFEAASVVRRTLEQHRLHPTSANVFTLGVHARRSQLVFAKVLQSSITVGVISWTPPHFLDGPWWRSSERSLELLKETVGYFFELFLNSGRLTNHT